MTTTLQKEAILATQDMNLTLYDGALPRLFESELNGRKIA